MPTGLPPRHVCYRSPRLGDLKYSLRHNHSSSFNDHQLESP